MAGRTTVEGGSQHACGGWARSAQAVQSAEPAGGRAGGWAGARLRVEEELRLLLEQRLDKLGDGLCAATRLLDEYHVAVIRQCVIDGQEGAGPALDHQQHSRHAQILRDLLLDLAAKLDLRGPFGVDPAVDKQEVRVLTVEGRGGARVLGALDVVHVTPVGTPVAVAIRVKEALLVGDLLEGGDADDGCDHLGLGERARHQLHYARVGPSREGPRVCRTHRARDALRHDLLEPRVEREVCR
eukprot:scaffold26043_cov61-Phaeocystis_antarctica.AAC.1